MNIKLIFFSFFLFLSLICNAQQPFAKWIFGVNLVDVSLFIVPDTTSDSIKMKFQIKNVSKEHLVLLHINEPFIFKALDSQNTIYCGFGIVYQQKNYSYSDYFSIAKLPFDSIIFLETENVFVSTEVFNIIVGFDLAIINNKLSKRENKNFLYDNILKSFLVNKEFYNKNRISLKTTLYAGSLHFSQ